MKTCSVEGCDRSTWARGWCRKHYQRWRSGGDPSAKPKTGFGTESPATKKATVHPTTRDLEWAAGFLEGEGSFDRRTGKKNSGRVQAYQVNFEPIGRLLALFGGAAKKYRQAGWYWYACGSRARGIMMTLYPLMSARRQEQIRVALV